MAKFRTLDDVDVKGKRVLLRVDLNVPMENGRVADATRIERILPTIREIAGKGGKVDKNPLKSSVEDFYLTNPIARASAVMAECSRLASGKMLTAAE